MNLKGEETVKNILRAIEFAVKAHGMTPRKYAEQGQQVPYFIHVVRVMRKVEDYLSTWSGGARFRHLSESMLIVAALHDVVEDTKFTLDDIKQEFGEVVAEGLYWLTNPSKKHPDLRRAARKQMDVEHLAKSPMYWQVIKLFDRIDNLYDLLNADRDFIVKLYIPESETLLAAIGNADPAVAEQLRAAIDWLRVQVEAMEHAETKAAGEDRSGSA